MKKINIESNITQFIHSGMILDFKQTQSGYMLRGISTGKHTFDNEFLPFNFNISGNCPGMLGADQGIYKNYVYDFKQYMAEEREDELIIGYRSELFGCSVVCNYEFVKDAAAFYCTMRLIAKRDLSVTDFYPVFPISNYSARDGENLELSYRRNKWQGEGQWFTRTLSELDFEEYSVHPPLNDFSIVNLGSQTTVNFYPSLILKNNSTGESVIIEGEPECSWKIGLSQWRSWSDSSKDTLLFYFSEAEERNLHSQILLKKGESLETPRILVAVGNSTDPLMKSVYMAKRSSENRFISSATVVYNDYMNGLWAQPDEKKEKPLIEAAAKLGCDYFVIDDGWQVSDGENFRHGDWTTDSTRFGEIGVKGMLDYIAECGMKPGLWLEPEVVGINSLPYREHTEWLLTVGDRPYGYESRYFLDYRNPEVRAYLTGIIKRLYGLGVRYIKLDYNCSYLEADGGQNALKENTRAIKAFYREIAQLFPDLVLENCASGAKRSENGFLREFDLQSVSDQEIFSLYPSVIIGSSVNSLPEKTGIWAMPQPMLFNDRLSGLTTTLTDEGVIFNLINGMMGVMTLGSMIDKLSERHAELVKSAIAIYKNVYNVIKDSYPEYPLGLTRIRSEQHALLWKNDREDILVLWATGDPVFKIEHAERYRQVFPATPDCVIEKGKITLCESICARIFVFNK